MSSWFDERYITLFAVLAGALPVMLLFLPIGLFPRIICLTNLIFIARQWHASCRLFKQIEALIDAGKPPNNDATKLGSSAGVVLGNTFMLVVYAWVVAANVFIRHHR
jgi:hypothetical protein